MGKREGLGPSADVSGQQGTVAKPSRVRYRVLVAACSLALVAYIHRVGFARALPKIQSDLSLSNEHLSWLAAAFLLAYALFEVPWGILADRLGVRLLLTILVLCWSLLTGCAAVAAQLPNTWLMPLVFLLLTRFLFGMFQAGGFPSLSRMMTDWMPMRERASAQGFIWMSSRIGGAIGPFVVVWLIASLGSWETALWAVAALGFVWCAAYWPWFRNRPEEMAKANAAERQLIVSGRLASPPGHARVPWVKMLRSKNVWALCLMYGCGGFASNFYVTLLSTYLEKHRGLPDGVTSLLSSLPFACGLVACLGGGLLSDGIIRWTGNRKWGRRLNGSVGTVIGGLGWLFLNWADETWLLGLLLCVIFFCNDLAMGPAWAACADIGERYAGTLGGAMNMVGSLLGAAGSLLAGQLLDAGRPGLLFTIYAGSFWLATLCWQGVDVTKRLEERT